MSTDYYVRAALAANARALASDLNTQLAAIETGLGYLPSREEFRRHTNIFAVDSGAANAYTVTRTDADTSYGDGMLVRFKVGAGNTNAAGASTINVDILGAKSIVMPDGTNPPAGDLTAGDFISVVYDLDNDRFIIHSPTRSMMS